MQNTIEIIISFTKHANKYIKELFFTKLYYDDTSIEELKSEMVTFKNTKFTENINKNVDIFYELIEFENSEINTYSYTKRSICIEITVHNNKKLCNLCDMILSDDINTSELGINTLLEELLNYQLCKEKKNNNQLLMK